MITNTNTSPLCGPFARKDHVHFDETNAIHTITASQERKTMIDVGAHHGSAFLPFLNDGWTVFAFEPDNINREVLLRAISKHKHRELVSLDARCIGNKILNDASFFRSAQSTGISSLSAFHSTHVAAQHVDVTTLTEVLSDKPGLEIEFLKIDTEGHDLFVLQGFPWERGQPAVIECEFEDTKTVPLGYTFHDLAQYLVEKGYSVYVSEWHPILRYGIPHDWHQLKSYRCELADPKGWGNLLAFRDQIDEEKLLEAANSAMTRDAWGLKYLSSLKRSFRSIAAMLDQKTP